MTPILTNDGISEPYIKVAFVALAAGVAVFLALLPTDARAIRTVCAVIVALCLSLGLIFVGLSVVFAQRGLTFSAVFVVPVALLCNATAAALAPTLTCGDCTRLPVLQPRQALRRLWLASRDVRHLLLHLLLLLLACLLP